MYKGKETINREQRFANNKSSNNKNKSLIDVQVTKQ